MRRTDDHRESSCYVDPVVTEDVDSRKFLSGVDTRDSGTDRLTRRRIFERHHIVVGGHHGIDDGAVSRAATQHTAQRVLDRFGRWVGIGHQERVGAHEHARSAKTALGRAVASERILQSPTEFGRHQMLDRGDGYIVEPSDRDHTGTERIVTDENCARTAVTGITTNFRSLQSCFVTKERRETPRRCLGVEAHSIDLQRHATHATVTPHSVNARRTNSGTTSRR